MAKRDFVRWGGWWVVGGLVIVAVLTFLQIWVVRNPTSWFAIEPNLLGDSFGAMNAIISALAFVAFIMTLLLQRHELQLQREELKETQNELRGSRQAQESQVEMSLRWARITALGAMLNHKSNDYGRHTFPPYRLALNIEMNRWSAELEAEITSLHYIGEPWQAAKAMLHQARAEIRDAQVDGATTFNIQIPDDLPTQMEDARRLIDKLLDDVTAGNSALDGVPFQDTDDPLKPILKTWLLKAREQLLPPHPAVLDGRGTDDGN